MSRVYTHFERPRAPHEWARKSKAGKPGKEEEKVAGRGRPPKPTALKILEGNPGKRPLNTDEPKPKSGAPKCPSFLSPEAKKEWRRIVRALADIDLLTSVDMAVLAAYCQSYSRWMQAEKILETEGLTYVYTNKKGEENVIARPEVRISQESLKLMRAYGSEIGLSPSSRGRIKVAPRQSADPFGKDFDGG